MLQVEHDMGVTAMVERGCESKLKIEHNGEP